MNSEFLESMEPALDVVLGGRYHVVRQLASGGFGQTLVAKDLHLPGQPICVVKQLKSQAKTLKGFQVAQRLFDTEAEVLYQLGSHTQIPQLLAHFTQNQEFYLAQELIEGHPLSNELKPKQPWPEIKVVEFLADILNTLAFVHFNRVIHRDIKPSNLIRRKHDERIVLIDFGAVKQAGTHVLLPQTSAHTIAIGTQGYIPNEQIAGMPQFSSDIYAVGMTGIQALTGQHPKCLRPNLRTGEIEWHQHAPETDPELVALLDRMVKYDFRFRYTTASEALSALQALPDRLKQTISFPFEVDTTVIPEPKNSHPSSAIESLPAEPIESLLAEPQEPISPPSSKNRSPLETPRATQPPVKPGKPNSPKEADKAGPSTLARKISDNRPNLRPTPSHEPVTPTASTWDQFSPGQQSLLISIGAISIGAIVSVLVISIITWRIVARQIAEEPILLPDPIEEPAPSTEPPPPPEPSKEPAKNTDPSNSELPRLNTTFQQTRQSQESEQYEQALAEYDAAIAANPGSSDAYLGRCYMLNHLQRYQEAIAACDQTLALAPNDTRAFLGKGYALELQEQVNEALELYDQALVIDPDFAEAWVNKGSAQLKLGNFNEAVQSLNNAIAINPGLGEAWLTRGVALWDSGQPNDAVLSVDRALELAPNSQAAANLRAQMRSFGY
ncbi:MAG: tetratricopeptide repeat protein [Cyanobacteria bacterium J06627_8]